MTGRWINPKILLIAVLFLWMSLEPLHLAGHSDDHTHPCEICLSISQQSLTNIDTDVSVTGFIQEEAQFSLYQPNFKGFIAATFHQRRGPPLFLS